MSNSTLPRDPITGQADASTGKNPGRATINYKAPANFYAGAILIASVTGQANPNWTILAGAGGPPLAFGAGQRVSLGPVLMDPGEQLVITVAGADPGALVIGQWIGFQADTQAELLGILPGLGVPGKTDQPTVSSPQTFLGSFVVPNAGTNTKTYPVPAGTHAIGILIDNNNGGLQRLTVTGVQSGVDYVTLIAPAFVGSSGQLKGFFISPILSALDTQVKVTGICSASGLPIGPTTVYSVGILDAEGVFVYNNIGEPTAFFITDQNGTVLGTNTFQGGHQLDLNSLPVVAATPTGTYTSAVVSIPSTNQQTFTLLAANVNRRGVIIYVNSVGPTGGGTGIIDLYVGTVGAGTLVAVLPPAGYWEMPSPVSTVIIQAKPEGASLPNNVLVTEIT